MSVAADGAKLFGEPKSALGGMAKLEKSKEITGIAKPLAVPALVSEARRRLEMIANFRKSAWRKLEL